ncbi:MATE family efflux transporter [Nitratifractor sp.]
MNRSILRLALPNILSNISVPLLGSVDTALMGHLSAAHLAALGVGAMIFMFLYSSFGFLRMGTTAMAAQAYGAGEGELLSDTFWRGAALALTIASGLFIFQNIIFDVAVWALNVDPAWEGLCREYFSIRIWGVWGALLLYVQTGWLFGVQNARAPLAVTLVINLLNLALSLYLVRGLGWGIAGVAWGTVAAQYAGVAFGFWRMGRYAHFLRFGGRGRIFDRNALRRFAGINGDIFVRTLALTLSLGFFYAQAAKGGMTVLGEMVVLMQFLLWLSFAVDGFANAAEAVVGHAFGAEDRARLRWAVRLSFLWGGGLAVGFAILYGGWTEELAALFTDDSRIVGHIGALRPMVFVLPLVSFWAFILDGIFVGLAAARAMRTVVLLSAAGYVGPFYIFKYLLSYDRALWIAFLLFFALRGAIGGWMLFRRGVELGERLSGGTRR